MDARCRMLIFGTVLCVAALTLFGCGSDPDEEAPPCGDDEIIRQTDNKYERKFAIGGSLIVSPDHLDFNLSNADSYVDLDILYFDELLWQDNNFVDPLSGNPIEEIMQSRKCHSAHYKRQHEIRAVIDNSNFVGSYFMWSFRPTFSEDVDLNMVADRLAAVVASYGDGVNLIWEDDANSETCTFTMFLCALHKSFADRNLASSKISVSGAFTSLWQKDSLPDSAIHSNSDGRLGHILKSKCMLPETVPDELDMAWYDEPTQLSSTGPSDGPTTPEPPEPAPAPTPCPAHRSMSTNVIDAVNWIEAEVYGLNARKVFKGVDKTPSGKGDRFYFNRDELNHTMSSLGKSFNKSKVRIAFKTGEQSGAVWEGPKTDLELMYGMKNDMFGGVSFWGMNAFQAGGTAPSKQSPVCLDPDVTLDVTFRSCGDKNPKFPICVTESSWNSPACAWWQGDTPLNAVWLIDYFKQPVEYDECPFNHSVYCNNNILPPKKKSMELVV